MAQIELLLTRTPGIITGSIIDRVLRCWPTATR